MPNVWPSRPALAQTRRWLPFRLAVALVVPTPQTFPEMVPLPVVLKPKLPFESA